GRAGFIGARPPGAAPTPRRARTTLPRPQRGDLCPRLCHGQSRVGGGEGGAVSLDAEARVSMNDHKRRDEVDSPAKPGVASRSMPAKEETRERKSLVAFTETEWDEIVKAAAGVPPA